MLNEDKKEFVKLMKSVMAVYGREFNGEVVTIWWEALKDYEFNAISQAMSAHTKTSEFAPTPASVLKHLPDTSGWLSPEEAWSALPKTEYDGGFVTQQIMSAAPFDALDRGDLIGGRMAFLETYKKLVTNAKAAGEKPAYFYSAPSMGDYETKQGIKEQSLLIAKEKSWISPTTFQKYALELDRPIRQDSEVMKLAGQIANGSERIEQK